jgi:hypothetical protein
MSRLYVAPLRRVAPLCRAFMSRLYVAPLCRAFMSRLYVWKMAFDHNKTTKT